MLNRKRRNVNGKNEEYTAITAHVLLLNTLFVLSVFRENRWTKSALLFGCWLIVFIWTAVVDLSWGRKRLADTFEAVVLLRGSSPNSRHIDCIFSFLYKGLSFLAGEYAKIKAAGARKPWKSQINAKLI